MSCETRRLSYKVVVRLVGWDLPQSHRACTVHHIRALAPRYVRQLRAVLLPITFVHIQSLLSPPGEWRGLSTGPFLLSYSVFMAAESKAIIFCRCNLFFLFLSAQIKDQPWDLNQTWPVGRKWCWFTNAPQNFGAALPQIWSTKKNHLLDHFFATSALDTAYLRNEMSHRQIKMLMSIYNVSPKIWTTFRDLWPRNGWEPFLHSDPSFGDRYVATIKVATCLHSRLAELESREVNSRCVERSCR